MLEFGKFNVTLLRKKLINLNLQVNLITAYLSLCILEAAMYRIESVILPS